MFPPLHNLLLEFAARHGVHGAAVFNADGLVIDFAGDDLDIDRLGALISSYVRRTDCNKRCVRMLKLPSTENISKVALALVDDTIFALMMNDAKNEQLHNTFPADIFRIQHCLEDIFV